MLHLELNGYEGQTCCFQVTARSWSQGGVTWQRTDTLCHVSPTPGEAGLLRKLFYFFYFEFIQILYLDRQAQNISS